MPTRFDTRVASVARLFLASMAILLCLATPLHAQSEIDVDDLDADPTKLFERGQSAHARGDLERALRYYEEAIKLRPEFPEAEFQRGSALTSLKRFPEAESAFRRTIELRGNWALAYANLGVVLTRTGNNAEAEKHLRRALELEPQNEIAIRFLADLRLRAGDAKEALVLAQRATKANDAPAAIWVLRAMAERATGDKASATTSLKEALELEPQNIAALVERADLLMDADNHEGALKDLKVAHRIDPADKAIASRLAIAYERTGQAEEARKIASSAGLVSATELSADGLKVMGTPEEIAAANGEDPVAARKALHSLSTKNPRSAMLLARLGASYRTEDPTQSLEFYRRAAELQPANPDYAAGYASALVQARRFPEAIILLRKVVGVSPDNYTAHANLATALYAQKLFAEAVTEYNWLLSQKPDLAIAYYFIATAHDNLGEYPEALAAYETFVARANPAENQLEIDKVKLRLPSLRRQIQLGEGVKRKASRN